MARQSVVLEGMGWGPAGMGWGPGGDGLGQPRGELWGWQRSFPPSSRARVGKQHRSPGKGVPQSGADHSAATRARRENRGRLVELEFISYDSYLIKYFICITLCSYSLLSSRNSAMCKQLAKITHITQTYVCGKNGFTRCG